MNKRHNNLKAIRKKLRNHLTSAEAKLWFYIKNKQLNNRKFRRQCSIGSYIVDFYCPSEKLVIELDGEPHNNPTVAVKDEERDEFLRSNGIKLLRFENKEVTRNLEGVLEYIKQHFN